MTDRKFLCWVHDRLHYEHGDSETVIHMHRLRRIIAVTPKEQKTIVGIASYNSLKELMETLK